MRSTRTTRAALVLLATGLLGACGQPTEPSAARQKTDAAADAVFPEAQGKVVLDISGEFSKSNSPKGLSLDVATLESLPITEGSLYEPFVKADVSFSGVLLSDLLEAIGTDPEAKGIFMRALDDYSIEISIQEALDASALLATREEGAEIKIRNGGPVRLVFLEESGVAANSDMWIWSVNRMKIHR